MLVSFQAFDKAKILREAITGLKQVTGLCKGLPREFCPHILGTKHGEWRALSWQFAGLSEKGELPGWRCFDLDDLEQIAIRDGKWHRGYTTGQREQHHIDQIDTVVHPDYAAEIRESSREHRKWPSVQRQSRRK